jgi:hypothetical protein
MAVSLLGATEAAVAGRRVPLQQRVAIRAPQATIPADLRHVGDEPKSSATDSGEDVFPPCHAGGPENFGPNPAVW